MSFRLDRWCLTALGMTTLACVLGAATAPASAQEPATFVLRLGDDTVGVERFTRTADHIEGRMVLRSPRVQIYEYEADLGSDGSMTSFTLRVGDPGEEPQQRARIDFDDGTATMRMAEDDSIRTLEVPAVAGAVPLVPYSIAIYEPTLVGFRQSGSDRLETQTLFLGSEQTGELLIESVNDDEVRVTSFAGESRARVDADGRILAWDGTPSTLKVVAERQHDVDFDALAAEFAAREASEGPLGTLSPGDSLSTTIDGATLQVNYSRPSTRGRTIFGDVVPWNEVWRTGANAATRFRTDRDLMIGDAEVPAGEYTLWTIPSPDGWTLIINQQTGQWGTQYDQAEDLARIPMSVEPLTDPIEQFTIGIDASDDEDVSGLLWMSWDRTCATVPFEVR